MNIKLDPHALNDDHTILRNLVRLYAYELIAWWNSTLLDTFAEQFETWSLESSGKTDNEALRHHVHRLCDLLLDYLSSHSSTSPPPLGELEKVIRDEPQSGAGEGYEIGERLVSRRYDYWGLQSSTEDDLSQFISGELIGSNLRWLEAMTMAARAARCDFPVMITGETGTGKELVARQIHANSLRASHKFTIVNCAALPESLVESELFGYAPGAFTGAARDGRRGWLETAAGGTLILDEISELSPHAQAVLLRSLQDGEIQKVGGEMVSVDFRLIATSNRPLEAEVEAGRFRRDLYYRVSVIQIHLPSMKDRPDDIEPLAVHILERFKRSGRGISALHFSSEAIEVLKGYHWSGNVRELENVVARALVLCRGETIESQHLVFSTPSGAQEDTLRLLSDRIARLNVPILTRVDLEEMARLFTQNRSRITSSVYARRFGCSETTARRHLEALHQCGLLSRQGSKRGSHYILNDR